MLLLAAACSPGEPSAPAPQPTPPPAVPQAAAPVPAKNPVLGLGEARNPEPFTLGQRLLDAARRNDRPTIVRALELGADLHVKDEIGRNALFLAVMDGKSLDLVRWLHEEKKLGIDDPDVTGRTPLSFATDTGQLDVTRYLVEQGAAVDSRDFNQRTPLMHAAGADHPDVIAYLVDHGADMNARDQFGDTPLIIACGKGNAASAALLLQRGADPEIRDQEGRTARERSAPGAEPCLRLPR